MAAFDKANIYVRSTVEGEFWQGEILSDVAEFQWLGPGIESATLMVHPLAIICSADCDLTQDFNSRTPDSVSGDKLLPNILLCDVVEAEKLREAGKPAINSAIWNNIEKNKVERYHYLSEIPKDRDLDGQGFEALALDFKQCFCISTRHLQRQMQGDLRRRCRLDAPFSQHLAQRFFYYHCRIGLPIEHNAIVVEPSDDQV